MKNYTITVNGNVYEVSVEENTNVSMEMVSAPVVAPSAAPAPQPVKSAPQPVKPAPQPAKPAASASGSIKVESPMPGKILAVKANPGTVVKTGDVLVILEAMKMENEIVAPKEGTVASINVNAGQSVEAGDLLATLN